MKKMTLLFVAAALMIAMSSVASAQTATGTLTVTATVTGSINLVFNSDANGVPLGASGTPNATLAFGNVSAFGPLAAGVARTTTATDFTVSSAVDVQVTKTNSASANYTLTAQLGTADATNTWTVGGVAVTSAAASTVTATGAYAANSNFAVAITIPFTAPNGAIGNTINYTATAN